MNFDFIAYPLGALLKLVFNMIHDYGISIIIFTILIKLVLLPINYKQIQSSKRMNEIQPMMKEIQDKYKNDKEKMNQKLMELYKEQNYNPASGCLPALIQMPILFALYYVIQSPMKFVFNNLPEYQSVINEPFLWMTNLGKPELHASLIMVAGFGIPILAILSGLTTWYQMKMIAPKGTKVDPTQQMMTNIMPIMFAYITLNVPSGLALYWVVGNLFTIVQQYFMMKPATTAAKEVK